MLFHFKKTVVDINFGFFGMFALISFMKKVDASVIIEEDNLAFYLFLASILHESAHLLVMYRQKRIVEKIQFHIGGITIAPAYSRTKSVLVAGVTANFLLTLFFWKINFHFAAVNFWLGIFNLLPFSFTDGGQFLENIFDDKLAERFFSVTEYFFIAIISVAVWFKIIDFETAFFTLALIVGQMFFK